METSPLILCGVMNSASAGAELADRVVILLSACGNAVIDVAKVERMTPSFANSFVMRVMRETSSEDWRTRVIVLNAAEHVNEALIRSAHRFDQGIRLSDSSALAAM